MKLQHIFRKIRHLLPLLLLLQGGCDADKFEDIPHTLTSGNEVTISLNVPGIEIPHATRSIADGAGEAVVKTVDIFIFDSSRKLLKHQQETVDGVNNTQSSSAFANYKVSLKAVLDVNVNAKTIMLVANLPSSITPPKVVNTTTRKQVLESLLVEETGKWATSTSGYTAIPMYGEYSIASGGIVSGMSPITVTLTRMLARIDVINKATSAFELQEVHLVNRNTKGYIAPAWNTNGELTGTGTDANIPSSPGVKNGATNTLTYTLATGVTQLVGDIYTFEVKVADDTSTSAHDNSICLVVKGKLKSDNQTYYYRIDFKNADGSSYIPLTRNYKYIVSIDRVSGKGYSSVANAIKSVGALSNITATTLTVDENGILHIVYDSKNYLGASKRKFTVNKSTGQTGIELDILTDYAGGWKASKNVSWITLSNTTGAANTKGTLTFAVTSGTTATGTILLNAGRLNMEITVKRE